MGSSRVRRASVLCALLLLVSAWPAGASPASASSPTTSSATTSSATASAATAEYTLVRLALPPGYRAGQVTGLNASGHMAGGVFQPGEMRPVLWSSPTRVRLLRLPKGAVAGVASDVDDSGDVVGYARGQDGRNHAVAWKKGHHPRWLKEPAGTSQSFALAVNEAGDTAGIVQGAQGDRAAFWPGSAMRSGRAAPTTGPPGSSAFDVNGSRLTAGAQASPAGRLTALTWTPGRAPTPLRSVIPGGDAVARGVNDAGLVVGFSEAAQGTRAVSWRAGQPTVLPLPPGTAQSQAWGVNSAGHVVGRGMSEEFDALVPVVWTPSGARLLPALGDAPWQWTDTTAINDSGMVVGYYEEVGGPELQIVPLAWLPR